MIETDQQEIIELRAQAIYEADPESGYRTVDYDEPVEFNSDVYGKHVWDMWRKIAAATIEADYKAGFVTLKLVNRE